ncbi:MAG: SIMPL domain-containing protein [Candidatus Paceibacterota bacterium]
MEEQSVREIIKATERVRAFVVVTLSALTLFLIVGAIGGLKSYRYIGSGVAASNTINVSGEGEVFAVPDTATFSVSVIETAKDVTTAQTAAVKKGNDIVAYLKSQGINEKDIQTTDYSVNPQYEYTQGVCPSSGYCPPGRQVLTGFQVSETLTVKVRDTTKAGTLLSGVGTRGASNVSGLSFTIADEDLLKAQARDKAIAQAKAKAEVLAKSLGVNIVRVVGFNENDGDRIYYAKTMALGMGGADSAAAPAPEIQTGQNKITSNVNITYEIR